MSKETQEIEEEDLFAKAEKAVEDLYIIRDNFFPANPVERTFKLETDANVILQLIRSIPADKKTLERAKFEYLVGKVFDVFPVYKKEAEDHLSKAVKLNPSNGEAWLCLGNCFWKKGDLSAAKNCFTTSLSKDRNKKALCELSMLQRRMAIGAANKVEIVEESIKHAKDAVALDIMDGTSWYNLGNAYMTSFFATGSWEHEKLVLSLKAYVNAERDEKIKSKADLHFNCAMVNKYLEDYKRALSGFEAAASKDPGLNAAEEVQKIVVLLDKLVNLLREHTKARRLASVTSSLAAVNVNPSYERRTINHLTEGVNKDVAVVGKVLFSVQESFAPLYYILCDEDQVCYVLSVYGIRVDTIKGGDQVTLLNPCYRQIDFSWKEKSYKFKSARVDLLEQVLLNGRALSSDRAVRAEIVVQNQA